MALAARRPAYACLRFRPAARQFSEDALVKTDTYIPVNYAGRQAVSGITATCFGATGFLGNYVVQKLARVGSDCIVPYRGDGLNTRHLKIMGDLGKVVPLPVDFADASTLKNTVARSNVVINMVGGLGQTRNYSYHDTNVKIVHRICKVADESNTVKRFIHISALGADLKSPSALLRAKAEGEAVLHADTGTTDVSSSTRSRSRGRGRGVCLRLSSEECYDCGAMAMQCRLSSWGWGKDACGFKRKAGGRASRLDGRAACGCGCAGRWGRNKGGADCRAGPGAPHRHMVYI